MDVMSCRSIRESMSSLQLTAENLKKQSAELEADERALESKVRTHTDTHTHTQAHIHTKHTPSQGAASRTHSALLDIVICE